MHRIALKPLSINEAWKGRRFRTDACKAFQQAMALVLPKRLEIPEGKLMLMLQFGVSSKNADIDNPAKVTIDCLQKKYGFNDKRIYGLAVQKVDVPKGQEFIEFAIAALPSEEGKA